MTGKQTVSLYALVRGLVFIQSCHAAKRKFGFTAVPTREGASPDAKKPPMIVGGLDIIQDFLYLESWLRPQS